MQRESYPSRLLVVVHNLNVKRIGISPNEAQPIAIIDSNTVLAFSVSSQCFESIPAWNRQIVKLSCPVQNYEFLESRGPERCWNAAALACFPQLLRVRVSKALNHE